MNTQKIRMSTKSARGFTLVELIVVITILVILGTIAFLNMGSFSASARDSQRTSDLNQINSQIMTVQAKQGIAYSTLVTTNTSSLKVLDASISGNTGSVTANSYSAGDLNYGAIGIDSAKFQDPISKVPYKIGQTTLGGGAYEISATMEEVKKALVMGIYRSRTIASTTSTGTASTTNWVLSILLSSTPSNFKVGDSIIAGTTAGPGTAQITAISADTKTLTLSGTMTLSAAAVSLAYPEVTGLTSSGSATQNANAVTNGGTVLPYAVN